MDKFLLGRCISCQQFVFNNEFKEKNQLDKFAKDGLCYLCQSKKCENYDVEHFLEMIFESSEEQILEVINGEIDSESFNENLESLFEKYNLNIFSIIEGKDDKYDQPTSKERILAALYEIKNLERGENDF